MVEMRKPDDLTASEAKAEAETRLRTAQERWPMIRAVVEPLLVERQNNNFAGRIRRAMQRKGTL